MMNKLFKKTAKRSLRYFSEKVKLDPYLILEINRGAEWKLIKQAYFKLARIYHPDLNKGDERANKKFIQIKEAYEYFERKYNPEKHSNIRSTFSSTFEEDPVKDEKEDQYESIREKNKKKSNQSGDSFTIDIDNDIEGDKFTSWTMEQKMKLDAEKQISMNTFLFHRIPVPRSERMIDRLKLKPLTAKKNRIFGPEDYIGFSIISLVIGLFLVTRLKMYYTNKFSKENLDNVNIYNALKASEVVKVYEEHEVPPIEQAMIKTQDHKDYKQKQMNKKLQTNVKTNINFGTIKDVPKVNLKKKFNDSL